MLKKFFILLALCTLPAFAMESPQKKAKIDFDHALKKRNKKLFKALDDNLYHATQEAIESGADLEARSFYDETPLMIATEKENQRIVKMLLEKGADVNAQDFYIAMTPLMRAVRNRDPENTMNLLRAGADLFIKSKLEKTALNYVFPETSSAFFSFLAQNRRISKALTRKKRHYQHYLISHSYSTPYYSTQELQDAQARTRTRIWCMKKYCPMLIKDVLEFILKLDPETWKDACATPLRIHSKKYDRVSEMPLQTLRPLIKKGGLELDKTVDWIAREKLERVKSILPQPPENYDFPESLFFYGLEDLLVKEQCEENFGAGIRDFLKKSLSNKSQGC